MKEDNCIGTPSNKQLKPMATHHTGEEKLIKHRLENKRGLPSWLRSDLRAKKAWRSSGACSKSIQISRRHKSNAQFATGLS